MTIIMGDVHGCWGDLEAFILKENPEYIIVCGDFGLWENNDIYLKDLNPYDTKIYWCPGNHENWDLIESQYGRHGYKPIETKKNIFYCPIGSKEEIEGKTYMFIGGAESIDKDRRTLGVSWWEQEVLNNKDFEYLMDIFWRCRYSYISYVSYYNLL